MYFLLNMGIFQCHVSFQGCTPSKTNGWKLTKMKFFWKMMPFFQEVVFWCVFRILLISSQAKRLSGFLMFTKIPLRNGKCWSTHCTLLQPCSTICTLLFWSKGEEVNMVRPQVSKCEGTQTKTYKQKDMFMLRLCFFHTGNVSFWRRLDLMF